VIDIIKRKALIKEPVDAYHAENMPIFGGEFTAILNALVQFLSTQ
jgi:hypothetical protein